MSFRQRCWVRRRPRRVSRSTIYGSFAEEEQGIPPAEVEKFVAALRSAGIQNDVHVYDDRAHGFWLWVDQDREARSGPALDAWNRLKTYLSRTLGN